ncbi:MAG: pyridoxal phosphate-dependent aminotransferase, partial [Muribaculaceae bacterium]|nr:pyridoxal phosphate-dependent aminotransferase [Muribaculaceae bacterium]
MFPLNNEKLAEAIERLAILDISSATIRQICALAAELEGVAEEKMVHLEMGNPGLPAEEIGIEAE